LKKITDSIQGYPNILRLTMDFDVISESETRNKLTNTGIKNITEAIRGRNNLNYLSLDFGGNNVNNEGIKDIVDAVS